MPFPPNVATPMSFILPAHNPYAHPLSMGYGSPLGVRYMPPAAMPYAGGAYPYPGLAHPAAAHANPYLNPYSLMPP